MVNVNLGFVVTTLGRIEPLHRLMESLTGQLRPTDCIVVVSQGRHAEVAALGAEYAARGLPIVIAESQRGASLGRNTGVAALPHANFVVNFPNDTSIFAEGIVERIRMATSAPEFIVGGFSCWDERGPKTALPAAGTPLDRWNVWTVIEMGILMRRRLFDEVGGFDETIGPGATTPWQVAEGTDLLLRAMSHSPAIAEDFVWLPPDVHVDGISTAFGLTRQERWTKMRAYGRGTGRAMSVHGYPLWWRVAFALAGLLYGVRNPAPITLRDGWPMFVGRVEGVIGRTFGRRHMVSATR